MKVAHLSITCFILILTKLARGENPRHTAPPYPPSPIIKEVIWDFDSQKRAAPGSDLWITTWGDDGHLYTSWGDGGGFGGTNYKGRVKVGFARVEGTPDDLRATNICGGVDAEAPATFVGKPSGMLSIDGVLYYGGVKQDTWDKSNRCKSTDHGRTWTCSDWDFEIFFPGAFLNFGRDYEGARDNYVYTYTDGGIGGKVGLSRVSKDKIMERSAYEFFSGFDKDCNTEWTSEINQRQPVFIDPNGAKSIQAIYNRGLDRYILTIFTSEKWDGSAEGAWAIFDAPEPWGPWTTVAYYQPGEWIDKEFKFAFSIPTKWISKDGKDFVLIFSGRTVFDFWNTMRGRFATYKR